MSESSSVRNRPSARWLVSGVAAWRAGEVVRSISASAAPSLPEPPSTETETAPPPFQRLVLAALPDLSGGVRSLSGHFGLFDAFMRFAAMYLAFAAILVLLPLWFRRDGLRIWVAAGLGALLAIGLSAGIGLLWDRPRPFVAQHFTPLIAHGADPSFPSDHLAALGAVMICAGFASRRLALALGVIAVIVAFARVYVGVHYVSDVAGGFILGVACGALTWWLAGLVRPVLRRVDGVLIRWHVRPTSVTASTGGLPEA